MEATWNPFPQDSKKVMPERARKKRKSWFVWETTVLTYSPCLLAQSFSPFPRTNFLSSFLSRRSTGQFVFPFPFIVCRETAVRDITPPLPPFFANLYFIIGYFVKVRDRPEKTVSAPARAEVSNCPKLVFLASWMSLSINFTMIRECFCFCKHVALFVRLSKCFFLQKLI